MDTNFNRMAVTKINRNGRNYTALIVLDEHRKFTELSVFEPEEERILDQIVIARVEKVVPGINAAFVRISSTQKAYLPLDHISCAIFTRKQSEKKDICEGDELLVQIIREAVKTKDPVVSAQITLTGKYCLLQTKESNKNIQFGISRKIKGEKRKELLQFADNLKKELNSELESNPDSIEKTAFVSAAETDSGCLKLKLHSCEILLRTNSQQAGTDELREDILSLIRKWKSISQKAPHSSAYQVLNIPLTGYIRQMQSLSYDNIDYVYTDDAVIYENIKTALPYLFRQEKLVFYQDNRVPLSVLYHMEGNMESLTSTRVWLPSGGNLIMEQVETMTVIDVNSAKSSANREAMLQANLEAAVEIPRQLRLRNISGMILVDFINMDDAPKDEEQFIDLLKAELRKDTVPAHFIDITRLGLVEITRKKIRKSLKEILTEG